MVTTSRIPHRLLLAFCAISLSLGPGSSVLAAGGQPAPAPKVTDDTRDIVLNGMRFRPGVEAAPSFTSVLESFRHPENPYLLVRFEGPIGDPQIKRLEASGVRILDTLSFYTLLVHRESADPEAIRALAEVAWIGPWTAGMKASPKLAAAAKAVPAEDDPPRQYRVHPQRDWTAGELLPHLEAITDRFGGADWVVEEGALDGVGSLRMKLHSPEEAHAVLAELAKLPEVFSIHRWVAPELHNSWNRVYVQGGIPPFVFQQTPTVEYIGMDWKHLPAPGPQPSPGDVDLPYYPIHRRGLMGEGECVTVQDTGMMNLDFFQPFRVCTSTTICSPNWNAKVVCHYLANSGGAACLDHAPCDFHGTHVSGTVAGDLNTNPDGGYDFGDGIAPRAKLVMQDLGYLSSSNRCTLDVATGGLMQATRQDGIDSSGQDWQCRIHQNSWGLSINAYDTDSIIFDSVVWNSSPAAGLEQDWLPVVSAGNDGPSPGTLGQPATAKNVLTVGAADPGLAGSVNLLDFSSVGPTGDGTIGRIKPDVVTTGCAVSACGDNTSAACAGLEGFVTDQGTKQLCGTSMSAPTVSGAAALVRQYFREGWYPCGSAGCSSPLFTAPSAALVKAMIINGTMAQEDARYGDGTAIEDDPVPNNRVGYGWVNLENSLYFDGDRLGLRIMADRPSTTGAAGLGLETGETRTWTLYATRAEPLKVSLVWTDPAGTNSGNALINDLDLKLTSPSGVVYRGNQWSTVAGEPHRVSRTDPFFRDNLNNVEVVYLPSPEAGAWTVQAIGTNVPGRIGFCSSPCSQGFALVASGRFVSTSAAAADAHVLARQYGISGGCDGDAFLDNGERATLGVRVRNYGGGTGQFVTVTPTVAPDSALPASAVEITPATYTGATLLAGKETFASFQIRFLEEPVSFAGEYLKLHLDYGWDLGQGGTTEYLSIPLQATPSASPFLTEDFESASPPEGPPGWSMEWGNMTCTSGCPGSSWSGWMAGVPPQVVGCDADTPRVTTGQELKFGANDCATMVPCCQYERAMTPDLWFFVNQISELRFYHRFDSQSWLSGFLIDPDGFGTGFPEGIKSIQIYDGVDGAPWRDFRGDLRALQKIRGQSFKLGFRNLSGSTGRAATEQGSLYDDILIERLDLDFTNTDSGPPNLTTPANGATGVSVRPDLAWDDTPANGGRAYDVRLCADAACGTVLWSGSDLTTNLASVEPSLASLTTYYWQAQVEDDCAVGDWGGVDYFTTAQADFQLTSSGSTYITTPGDVVVRTVDLEWQNGYDGDLTLSCAGLPAGVSCAFTPATLPWDPALTTQSSTLELTVGAGAPLGDYTIQLVASGTIDGVPVTRPRNRYLRNHVSPGEPDSLTLNVSGGNLQLSWGAPSCDVQDYGIFAGDLEALRTGGYDHETRITCSTGGAKSYVIPLDATYASYDFDASGEGWTAESLGCAENLWTRTALCGLGNPGLYFGDPAACDYDRGARTCGAVVSPPIDLTAVNYAVLTFDYILRTEGVSGYDIATVEYSKAGTANWAPLVDNQPGGVGGLIDDGEPHTASIRIDGIARVNIQLRFTFDSIDSVANGYPGFFVDNVAIKNLARATYFLVNGNNLAFEGPYGQDSSGADLPPSTRNCRGSVMTAGCP